MNDSHANLTLGLMKRRREVTKGITLDGEHLSIPQVVAVCQDPGLQVGLSESALQEVELNEKYLKRKLNDGLIVYGINTGFGGSAGVRSWKLEEVQIGLIRSVNAGMGRVFPVHMTRAAMVTRANCLVKGYSGVRTLVPKTLVDLINADITPSTPMRGSVSASGDLMPLSYIAAAIIGREDLKVTVGGSTKECRVALEEAGIKPLALGPKEGLAIINADSFAAGVSAPAVYDANLMLMLTQVCTGLSVEALRGRTESFHPVIHSCLPHIGQKEIAQNMLKILDQSKMAITTLDMHLPDTYGVLKQDRYSLRCSPQWLGSVAETLKDACRRITIELNSANDNPIIDHRTDTIVHGGNFQGETLSITMDQTRQVMGVCGKLLFAQFSEVVNASLNFGLPPNLSGCDINEDWGFKGSDVAMASYMSELDHFVNPMSNHVLSAEMHNQSVNSLALVSARLTTEAIEIVQMMIANLLCLSIQAIDLRHLRNLVLKEIEIFTDEHPALSQSFKDIEWYDLLFQTEIRAAEVVQALPVECRDDVKDQLITKISNIYTSACSGAIDCSELMGKGTSKMYSYVRRDLRIPFYCGQHALDTWLNNILQAIQSRNIETVLEQIFSDE
ncbi:uncharacterized protein LOC127844711 [Dreissena polymorpha]|uniref:Phenylalanine ammonia-lyase n=1 Tax=Dreissena polymorpha TaxID=45954 RepID=A0A9D4ILM1_DREPO|nr:uncharacterized protein LOC127844711 [Dreissena polymorpha]KAH3777439.1 hypothetical protein DPMN_178882 [Dreissena polymorpha]